MPEIGMMLSDGQLSPDAFQELCILGWLIEILNGYLLVLDDIMDKSMTRRGKPCWYKRPDVGLNAINDGCLLKSEIFLLLRKYFKDHPSYAGMLESFHEISFQTELGQACDGLASMEEDPASWTWEQYDTINRLKAGYYTFFFSALLAMQYLGFATSDNVEHTKRVLVKLGAFYQVTNDYLDIFGDPVRTGKVGSDVSENKCSWVIIKALEICNEEQRAYLREYYGKDATETVIQVQAIFHSLPLKSLYEQEENDFRSKLGDLISEVPKNEGLHKDIYWKLFGCIEWCSQKQTA